MAEQEVGQQQLQQQLAAAAEAGRAAGAAAEAARVEQAAAEAALAQQLRRVQAVEGLRLADLQVRAGWHCWERLWVRGLLLFAGEGRCCGTWSCNDGSGRKALQSQCANKVAVAGGDVRSLLLGLTRGRCCWG